MEVSHTPAPPEGGGQAYLTWVYRQFCRLMFHTAQKYLADPIDQEEAVQEALRKLIEKEATLRGLSRPALAVYIVTAVRHTAIDLLRQQERDRHIPLEDLPQEAAQNPVSLDEALILQEEAGRLRAVWPRLDEESRLLLEGKYILGYDNQELGQLLGCQANSVRMKLTRARRQALRLMGEEGNGHDKP